MCGIAGYAHLDGRALRAEADEPILARMGDAIGHRGPDETRTMLWQNVGFVFKRLSIVDVAHGEQPLHSHDGALSIIANGEIYNHRALRADLARRHPIGSGSDCAVLLPLYAERGVDFLCEANGMFALALLDRVRRRLLLARDRLGVKPLFHCRIDHGRTLVFASELKALFAHPDVPRRFDWAEALATISAADTPAHEHASGFRDIERVPAATVLCVDLARGEMRSHRYWSLPRRSDDAPPRPARHYVDRYRDLLDDSVQLRLPDEVGFGLFLSGGIDSAALAALAARRTSFPTFTVLSASTAADAAAAHAIAQRLALPNHPLLFDATTARVTPDHWREIVWACEMPAANAEQLYKFHLHAHARASYPDLKVMLIGQGSDEFNGGYIGWTLGRDGPWEASDWHAMRTALDERVIRAAAFRTGWGSPQQALLDRGVVGRDYVRALAGVEADSDAWRLYAACYRSNLDHHLWHEDRTAAAHAIENRVPFLDYRIVEWLACVPACHHAELFTDKSILRRAVADLLPREIAARPKGYFFYGRGQRHTLRLMYGTLLANGGELVEQALAGSAGTGGPLEADAFRAWVREVGAQPDLAHLPLLLKLVNMGLLADLAVRGMPPHASPPRLGRECGFDAWRASADGSAACRRAEGTDQAEDVVVGFPHGTTVVEVRPGPVGAIQSGVYVVTDGRLGMRIASPAWAAFLLRVDGRRSVAQILAAAQLNRARTWRQVRAALDDGSLVEIDAEIVTAPTARDAVVQS